MNKPALSLLVFSVLAFGCNTSSNYHDKLNRLQGALSSDQITTKEFIKERINLDMERGVEWSEKWNAVMLRNESTESIYDPIMYAHHTKLINEALGNEEIDLATAKELGRMATGARNARNLRSQKREIQRRKLLIR